MHRRLAHDAEALAADGGGSTHLNQLEQEHASSFMPITVFNLFRGELTTAIVDLLRARMVTVVRANPWLAGRVARADGGSGPEALFWPPAARAGGAEFVVVEEDPRLMLDLDYAAYQAIVRPLAVDGGRMGIPRAGLCRVTLVRGASGPGGSCFAVVVSIAHAVVDGFSFYRLYRMLAGTESVAALDPVRVEPTPPHLPGNERAVWLRRGAMVTFIAEMMLSKPPLAVRRLDAAWVAAAKARHRATPEVPFVSSHDVVTSALLSTAAADVGWFVVNLRGRAPRVAHNLAGNYATYLVVFPDEFTHPGAIRSILRSWELPMHPAAPATPRAFALSAALVTSWAFGSTAMDLPATGETPAPVQVVHLPVFNPWPMPPRLGIIFECRPGELAAIVTAPSERKLRARLAHPVFAPSRPW